MASPAVRVAVRVGDVPHEQWLRRVPQDPGGLLRSKFLYQYQRMGVDQDGKPVLQNGPERKPW